MRKPGAKSLAPLQSYRNSWAKLWLPPERLPLSQWAEKHFRLSTEYGPEGGPLTLYGWQRGIFDAWTDPSIEEVVLMCGTQLVKTLFIQAALAYSISEDPGPTLLVYPKDGDAKSFSKDRLGPMLRDCECLQGKVSAEKGRTSSNTIQEKTFSGGSLGLVGAISPGNLARRTIRYLFCDEVDKYPASAGKEGDPITLAKKRQTKFLSRKKRVLCCSPTVLGTSRIGKAYNASDRRKPWIPCPGCGEMQVLRWSQVKWQGDDVWYECVGCAAHWDDAARREACEKPEWRAAQPSKGIAGFWVSNLYSPDLKLRELRDEYLDAKGDRNRYQVFINTTLAELWQEEGETPDEEILFARREDYPHTDAAVIPQRGLFLTAAADVQDNPPRLEVEVVAWGRGRESWSIGYWVLQHLDSNGQPMAVTCPELWDKLHQLLQRDFRHESGHTMPILLMAIDTGSRPAPVYEFARKHAQPAYGPAGTAVVAIRSVVPIKGGDDDLHIIQTTSPENAARKRGGIRIVTFGTHCIKSELYDVLRHVKPRQDGGPVAGCYHFPQYEKPYFAGLCSEKRVVTQNGGIEWQKLPNARNEPLDLKVYNRGAASVFGIDRMREDQWLAFEEALTPIAPDQPPPAPPQPKQKKNSWIPERKWF